MSLQNLISPDLPETWCAQYHGRDVLWLATDTEEDYRKRGGHPRYGPRDITYRFNSRGYRCPEFDAEADLRLVSVGCSITVGVGLPQEALFHELFAERLRRETGKTVVNWNLAETGISNDAIARILHLAVPRLRPHLVLVHFTMPSRRQYLTVEDRVVNFTSSSTPTDRVTKEVFDHFLALTSDADDRLNFFRSYKSIECLQRGRPWLFSTVFNLTGRRYRDQLFSHVNPDCFVGCVQKLDPARDDSHPGPRTHRSLYEAYWARFLARGGPGLLQPPPA